MGLLDRIAPSSAAIVSVMILMLFGFALYANLYEAIPNNKGLDIMLGTITTLAVTVCNYWVGSSRGSVQKDNQIVEMARTSSSPALVAAAATAAAVAAAPGAAATAAQAAAAPAAAAHAAANHPAHPNGDTVAPSTTTRSPP